MIKTVAAGNVYRNPKPHLRAIHAWHPSLVCRSGTELVSTFDLGQGVESFDYHTCISRSIDGGETWSVPLPLFRDPVTRCSTHTVRTGAVSGGTLVGIGIRAYRDDPEEGLINRANLGYVESDIFLLRSDDSGQTWAGPQIVTPPLVGPAFEMCHRIIELADGRWLWPTSTWKDWNGNAPHGMQAVAFVSRDRGVTWPEYLRVLDQTDRGVLSWEQGLTQLPDGRLVAVVWSFEESTGKSLPNRFAISQDGQTFSPARENGILGETSKLLTLADGRLLCVYRRLDKPGLWANLVQIQGDDWINLEEVCLWQGAVSGMMGVRSNSDELSGLKFGYPSLVQLPDGNVLVVFWCVEDCLHVIRWQRLEVG
ncbi:MAG: hypothetical protein JWN70_5834 [Planctomycetaceae bacterium]|nr:hypothetical protein [Planctomycetaceae bacterium]